MIKYKPRKFLNKKKDRNIYLVAVKSLIESQFDFGDQMEKLCKTMKELIDSKSTPILVYDSAQLDIDIKVVKLSSKQYSIYIKDKEYWLNKQDLVIKDILE